MSARNPDLKTVLSRCLSDDREAWELLMRWHLDLIKHFCQRYIFNPEEQDDVVGEVFLALRQRLPRYAGRSSFATWLEIVCRSVCFDRLRRLQSQQKGDYKVRVPDFVPCPDERVHTRLHLRQIVRSIKDLPQMEQDVLWCVVLGEEDTESAATMLGISSSAVRTRLYRARRNMCKQWGIA